jgi:hypothetical protein
MSEVPEVGRFVIRVERVTGYTDGAAETVEEFFQTVDGLDLTALIARLNGLTYRKPRVRTRKAQS